MGGALRTARRPGAGDRSVTTVRVNDRWDIDVPEHRAGHWQRNPFWEPARIESMAANIKPGMVVYDVGAEQGDISALLASWVSGYELWSSADGGVLRATPDGFESVEEWHDEPRRVGPVGGVVLVEPGAWYWPTIRETFRLNGLPDPLYTWHGFAADRDQGWTENTHKAGGWPLDAFAPITGREAFGNVRGTRQPVITLDTLAGLGQPPDAITMDVEGAEILVARGADRVLTEYRPLVWVSVHAEAMFHDHGVYQAEFHSEFHRHGYEKVLLDFDHEGHVFYFPSERRDGVVLPCKVHGYGPCPP